MKSIEEIKARAEEVIELDKKALKGPWRWLGDTLIADVGRRPVILSASEHEGRASMTECRDGLLEDLDTDGPNANFIAHTRTSAPELARAVKKMACMIEVLKEQRDENLRVEWDESINDQKEYYDDQLNKIWEEE